MTRSEATVRDCAGTCAGGGAQADCALVRTVPNTQVPAQSERRIEGKGLCGGTVRDRGDSGAACPLTLAAPTIPPLAAGGRGSVSTTARGDAALECGAVGHHPALASGTLTVTVNESEEDVSPAQVEHALRSLARIIVRAHRRAGDPAPNVGGATKSSALTLLPHPSPDHGHEAA